MNDNTLRAQTLTEALPYMKRFKGKTIVVKYGGNAMGTSAESLMADMIFLQYAGIKPVLVHGGGPEINNLLDKMGKESQFVDGQRVTDEETMAAVEMVLAGSINVRLVSILNKLGVRAVGVNGKDANLLKAVKYTKQDIGFVGEIKNVDTSLLDTLLAGGFLPVVAPIAVGDDGESYNINADRTAGALAAALKAEKLLLLTDIKGIYREFGNEESMIPHLSSAEAEDLITTKVVDKGMIPKVKACIEAVKGGANKAHIIDGRQEHAILLELFTDSGIGTEVVQ
ncbi:MAG: acetylglutamate kinase [Brevinema sp.]